MLFGEREKKRRSEDELTIKDIWWCLLGVFFYQERETGEDRVRNPRAVEVVSFIFLCRRFVSLVHGRIKGLPRSQNRDDLATPRSLRTRKFYIIPLDSAPLYLVSNVTSQNSCLFFLLLLDVLRTPVPRKEPIV